MGKSGYKRFKKQEKARVKLKGTKTLLPKGQNITDTSFKVKKIVVKEQLKEHKESEVLTKKHLSIKELLSRLSHHNARMRQDALAGLKELVSDHGLDVVQDNLSSILKSVMFLIEEESVVRSDTLKLLEALFEKVTEDRISPLFPLVISHLTCAMTNIDLGIRSDSLRLLDILLVTLPNLTAANTPTLLPRFLDLISQRDSSGQGRTLSWSVEGQVTSEKWRAKVIGRLNKLFSVILEHNRKEESTSHSAVRWRDDQPLYLGLYTQPIAGRSTVDGTAKIPIKELEEYTNNLMPLLLATFMEAGPKQAQEESQSGSVVGVEVAALLQSIVEVILNIWELLKLFSKDHLLVESLKEAWGATIVARLVEGRFPYSIASAKSRKRKRESDQVLIALQVSDRNLTCSLLNLHLCLLVFQFTKPGDLWKQSITYMKNCLRDTGAMTSEEIMVLSQCYEAMSEHPLPPSLVSLGRILPKLDILTNTDKQNRIFSFLTNISLKHSHHFHQDNYFTTWLDSLPTLLCKPSVPLSKVRSICDIAARNFPAFNNSLDGWMEEILVNLSVIKVTGDKDNEGKKLIANLVYWVDDWDEEMVLTVKQMMQGGSLGTELTEHLMDIIRLKGNMEGDGAVNKILVDSFEALED